MNIATMILPQRMVEALGWTLFHALWQGVLAALAFAVILYFSRRASARARYGLGLAVLALMLLTSALTFRNHYRAAGPAAAPGLPAMAAANPANVTLPLVRATGQEPSRLQRVSAFFSDYFSRHLPLLVTLWLLGVLFLTLRFSGGMLYLQRLKYKQNRLLPPPWPDRLQQLAEKAGLKRPLQLLESLRLRTPVVVGHLKPVLLLPVGLAAGLPVDEVEALLAHELAHVVRRDYLVNVLQNLVEILYFFHPGLRWISAGVRQEREHCCDDFAVALCGDAQNYARALARLQIDGLSYPQPALAAVGRPQRLLRRIVRLLGRPRRTPDFREGFVSALLMVFGLLGMLRLTAASVGSVRAGESAAIRIAATAPQNLSDVPGTPAPPAPPEPADPASFQAISFDLESVGRVRLSGEDHGAAKGTAGTWLVNEKDGRVVWYMGLSAGGSFSEVVSLESGAYSWYRPSAWKAAAHCQTASGKGSWQPLTMYVGRRHSAAGELRQQAEAERQLKNEQLRKLEYEMQRMDEKERSLKERELHKLRLELAARTEEEKAMKEQERHAREFDLQARQQEEMMAAEEQAMRDQVEEMQVEEQRLRAEEKVLRKEEKNFQALIKELHAAGLAGKSGRYEVKLSAAALRVNGKKQQPAMHERIRKFYEKQFNVKLAGERTVTIIDDKD